MHNVEIIKTFIAFVIIAMVFLLASCAGRIEGSGFSNSGAYRAPACVKYKDATHEVWGNC